jgi:hypothetical protein
MSWETASPEFRQQVIRRIEQSARRTYRQRLRDPAAQDFLASVEFGCRRLDAAWARVGYTWPGWTSGHVAQVKAMSEPVLGLPPGTMESKVDDDLVLCQILGRRYGGPLWVLEEDCARALAATDPPIDLISTEVMECRLRLPFPSICLQLPPVFELHDEQTGREHPVEAIEVCMTWGLNLDPEQALRYPNALAARQAHEPMPMLLIVAIGKARGCFVGDDGVPVLDDTLRSFTLGAGRRVSDFGKVSGLDAVYVVLNLLMALNAGYLESRTVVPSGPKNPAKAEKRERRGEVLERHTLIRLGQRARAASPPRPAPASGERDPVSAHFVRGHWHCYWVREPGDDPVLSRKPGKKGDGELHLVARWVFPFQRGSGGPPEPRYRVAGSKS